MELHRNVSTLIFVSMIKWAYVYIKLHSSVETIWAYIHFKYDKPNATLPLIINSKLFLTNQKANQCSFK